MKTTTALGLLLLAACAPAAIQQRYELPPPDPALRAAEQEQAALRERIEQARRALAAQPQAPREALDLCRAVEAAMTRRELLHLDVAALVAEASAAIDGAISARGSEAPLLLAAKGRLLVASGDEPGGFSAFVGSMSARPNVEALLPLLERLEKQARLGEVVDSCRATRPHVTGDDERFALLDACLARSHAVSVDGGLDWAEPGDITFYKATVATRAAERAKVEATRLAQQRSEEERREARRRQEQQEADLHYACQRQCIQMKSMCASTCRDDNACRSRCDMDELQCRGTCR